MGGTKKKSISQMLKAQLAKEEKKPRGKEETKSERKTSAIDAPGLSGKEFIEEIRKMKVITPYSLASKYNIKLSVAKDYLEMLESKGIVRCVGGHNRIRIFQVVQA